MGEARPQSADHLPFGPRRRQTAASPSGQLELPTLTGHPDFPEAAAEARWPSVSFAATKLPLVNPRLRPRAVGEIHCREETLTISLPYAKRVLFVAGFSRRLISAITQLGYTEKNSPEIKNRPND